MTTKKEYLDYIVEWWNRTQKSYDMILEDWRRHLESSNEYAAPGPPLYAALVEGLLFHATKDEKHAHRAKEALLSYAEFPNEAPDSLKRSQRYSKGIYPVTPTFGGMSLFLRAYEFIKDSRQMRRKDREILKTIIANTAESYFQFPEWGAHNRAAKSGLSLAYAAQLFPDHARAPTWSSLGKLMIDSSLRHWSLEDASMYCLIWLADLMIYLDFAGDPTIFESPMMKYYFDYFTNLFCPLGMVPDYGDSNWGSAWDLCMILMEKGATVYQNPYMKYVADRIFRQARQEGKFGIYSIFAYLWADDKVESRVPDAISAEVVDEVIGKKIVFRNGWEGDATYLLLNYMDEGDIGWYYKEHLRNTIVVTAEKMHHGHADENSIATLIKNGSFLLHDGGYREALPNGAYRSDVYHNRIVVRKGKPKKQTLFDFMHNLGAYQPVKTRKIHFKVFKDIDVSRTEVIDERNGYHWDRIITYLKRLDCFVVQDGLRILGSGELTIGNLFWTRQIHVSEENYFDTSLDLIGLVGAMGNPRIAVEERKRYAYTNRKGQRLLIYFSPDADKTIGTSEAMRCYLPEKCMHQSSSRTFKPGDFISFTTLLFPHNDLERIEEFIDGIEVLQTDQYPRATAIRLNHLGASASICAKHDLSLGLVRPNARPTYTYEAGKIRYGGIISDAAYVYTRFSGDLLEFAFIDGMKLYYKGKEVFDSEKPSIYDLSHRPDMVRTGAFRTPTESWDYELKTKWDSWEGSVSF